jgi:hypothetical protein
MPKIQLGTRDYLNFAKGWLGVHMSFSHGLFDNQGLIKHAYLHQKSLYGRMGKSNSLINIYGGINHQVSWGGEQNIKTNGSFDYFPSSLKAYFYVITLLKDRTLIKVDEKTSWDDANNQYGNHLGSIDFAVKLNLNLGSILLYKQTAYETGRIFSLVTADDGILGLSVKFKRKGLIEGFAFENLHTNNQGLYRSAAAKLFGLQDPHYPEYENYFNNHARGGWVYYKKSIGTPLIIVNSESQINGSSYSFKRNAVNSFYLIVYGHLKNDLTWMLKGSKSTHGFIEDGSNYPYSRYISSVNQFSSLIKLEKTFRKNIGVSVQLAVDSGKELKNTIGLAFSARYQLF